MDAILTSPRMLQERLMLLRVLFWASTLDRAMAVGPVTLLAPRCRWSRVLFFSKAFPMALPPSSLRRLRRRLRDKRVEFLDKAWAIALAPVSLITLSHIFSISSLLLLSSLPMALAPLSPIRLWEKSSSLRHGWSRRCFTSSLHLLSSMWLWWSRKSCGNSIVWGFDYYKEYHVVLIFHVVQNAQPRA